MAIICYMKVSELGEFGLISLLARIAPSGGLKHRMVVGIGDDAAAWRGNASTVLATTDALIEGVHFATGTSWWEVGWKALAVNLSDIAAMGGEPRYSLVNLSLPGETEVEDVASLYEGMADLANQFKVAIVGGNITSAPVVMIAVTVIGRGLGKGLLRRSAAVPGERITVTGYLGSAAGGLRMLSGKLKFAPRIADCLRRAYLQPQPRVFEGQLLVKRGVRAAIDISDGLVADLGHVCKASKVGAIVRVNELPVHPLLKEAFGEEATELALTGGEDYELLFTASERIVESFRRSVGAKCPVTVIGEITDGNGVVLVGEDGRPCHMDTLNTPGWEHFQKGG